MKTTDFSILALIALCAWGPAASAQGVYVKQGPNGPVFSDLRFPRFFVCQRVDFMLPVFPDVAC